MYVEKKVTSSSYPEFNSIQIYRLGGNSEYVWRDMDRFKNRTVNEVAAEDYGVSLDDIDFVTRTDFADGLIDNDGNGIDDRDPINGMGFIDLNHNGIDDRQALTGSFSLETGNPNYTDGSHQDCRLISDYIGYCYVCPHNVVCSIANPYTSYVKYMAFLPSFYLDLKASKTNTYTVYLDVVCPICNSDAYKCKSIGDKLNEIDAVGNNVSETVFGYEVGDTTIGRNGIGEEIVMTYIGEDVWLIGDTGAKISAYIGYEPGNSFEEIYSTRYIAWGVYFWY